VSRIQKNLKKDPTEFRAQPNQIVSKTQFHWVPRNRNKLPKGATIGGGPCSFFFWMWIARAPFANPFWVEIPRFGFAELGIYLSQVRCGAEVQRESPDPVFLRGIFLCD